MIVPQKEEIPSDKLGNVRYWNLVYGFNLNFVKFKVPFDRLFLTQLFLEMYRR